MTLSTQQIENCRQQFPALTRHVNGKPAVFLDGPAGTQVPQRVIDAGDPYTDELRTTAETVADTAGFGRDDWQIAWQSAGRTPEPWLGPDILDVIDQLGADDDIAGVVVCACGFVADHLEVLYDLDIEAAGRASAIGLAFDRSASVADDAAVISALAHRVHDLAST
jgi:ferrochelatase